MEGDDAQAPRRTWLAAERTFLAWWRTGLAAAVAALAVGRVLPEVVDAPAWPFAALGLGYAVLALGVFLAGVRRHREVALALQTGGPFPPLGRGLVLWLTVGGAALTLGTTALISTGL
ncbi:MAG TPA: DUF202 domain-containing protein [Capillimicrobium sp.]|nr:DUF202 domain-containing protein [Capillimicrobium sp.]